MAMITEENGRGTQRIRCSASKKSARRQQGKPSVSRFLKNTDARECPHQAMK
jgi:hypothetical protein